jgi:hypothetical protein
MRVHDTPFPYGVIDDFLPRRDYAAALAAWPAPADLSPVTIPGSAYLGSRAAKVVEERRGTCPPPVTDPPWAGISAQLRDPELVMALFARFQDTIDSGIAAIGSPYGEPGFRLHLCQDQGPQEALGAHLDGMHKLLTIVVYMELAGDVTADSPEIWGTALYDSEPRPAGPIEFAPNSVHVAHTRINFQPNRAFVMPNSRKALHGVVGGQEGVTRRSIMCGYWAFGKPSDLG